MVVVSDWVAVKSVAATETKPENQPKQQMDVVRSEKVNTPAGSQEVSLSLLRTRLLFSSLSLQGYEQILEASEEEL